MGYLTLLKFRRFTLQQLIQRLIGPAWFVAGREARLKATVFAAITLSGTLLYPAILIVRRDAPVRWADVGSVVGLAICYFLSRTRFYRHAIRLGVWLMLAWTFLQTADGAAPGILVALPILFSGWFC